MQKKTHPKTAKTKAGLGQGNKPDAPLPVRSAKKTTAKSKKPLRPKGPTAAQQARFKEYLTPEFTQRLVEHMHRAKIAALSEGKE